jgi:hypothetical protein
MELAAIIIVLGAALVGAGIAFGAAWMVDRFWGRAWPAWRVVAAGGVMGALLAVMVITGWPFGAIRFQAPGPIDSVTPYIEALKPIGRIRPTEDALYERLVTFIQRDRQEGRSEDEVRRNAVSQVLSHAADKVGAMPDDLVRDYYVLQRDTMAYLGRQKDFDTCRDLGLGRIRGDIEERLSEELVARQQALVLIIIGTPADPKMERLAQEPFQAMAAQAFALSSQLSGISPNEIEVLLAGGGDEASGAAEKTCRLMTTFFSTMLAEPLEVLAPALRALAAGERGAP